MVSINQSDLIDSDTQLVERVNAIQDQMHLIVIKISGKLKKYATTEVLKGEPYTDRPFYLVDKRYRRDALGLGAQCLHVMDCWKYQRTCH